MNGTRTPGRLILAALLLCSLSLATASAQTGQSPAPAKKVASIEGITEYKLENGFRYLLFPDPSSATVTINLTILVGSRHEGYGETGMAHLLEHMLFKGSKLYPVPDKALQEHGAAEYNGTTWVDRTNYYETMPGTDANLEFGIRFEADRLVNCFIKREDLAKEMTVVRNEFEMGENSPDYILSQRMMSVAYQWHNYGKSTIGNRADIERVPIDRLQAFYRKHYQPDNALLVIAGKFDEAKAHEYLAKYFGAIPRPRRVLDKTYTEEPPQDGERTVTLRRVGNGAGVGVIYHIPAGGHPDYAAVEVMERILLAAPAGRLYKALVETKKATKVYGGSYAWHDPGVLEVTAQVADQSTPDEVRDIMLKVLEGFTSKPATAAEVERARRELLADRERALAKSKSIAIELSEWAGAGDWRLLFLHRDRVAKVQPKDVDRVARAYLLKSNRTVGQFLPTAPEQVARAQIPDTPNLEQVLKDYKGGKAIAQGEKFDPTPENIEARVKRTRIGEGIKVALLPKKTRGESVVARLTLHFGNEKSLKGQTTAASLLGSLMMRGTKKYSRQDIEDQLDKLGARLAATSGLGTLSFAIQAKRETLPAVLDLLEEVLRHPTFPEDELGILQRAHKQGLQKGLTDPEVLAGRLIQRKLSPYPPDDVRYVPTLPEAIERLDAVTRDQVAKLYTDQVGAAAGELAVVGDFEPQPVLQKMERMLAGLKSAIPYERIVRTPKLDVQGGTETILTPDKKNAYYCAGHLLAVKDTAPDYPALEMANYILGGSGFTSLLTDEVRQKKGLSYNVGSDLSVSAQDAYGRFFIEAICNPDVMDTLDTTIAGVLTRARKEGVSATQLKEAQKGYLEEQKVRRAGDGSLAAMLLQELHLGRTMRYQADLELRIAALTPEEVSTALRRYLEPRRLVIVRAGDLGKGGTAAPK
jgi:zinc protease